jgi:hypothetical protein
MNKFSINLLQKIFKKDQVIDLLKTKKPDLFGKRNSRCRKEEYLGENLWEELKSISASCIKDYTRNYSISSQGKYFLIHNNLDWVLKTISETKISKEESPCHPEQFSESVVKPLIRDKINKLDTNILENCYKDIEKQLKNHIKERINQQLKADYSEYVIMMNCPNIIPTLKHTKGTDMYLLNEDETIDDLDIKTTRSTFGKTDPYEAIKILYENQGKDRFSSDPRLYIYLSDNEISNQQHIINQLNKKYDITFNYEDVEYKTEGARIIFI